MDDTNALLIEEYKQAREHYRYLEARQNNYLIGTITASGAALALISEFDFSTFANTNRIALAILCFTFGVLCLFVFLVHTSLDPVLKEYEDVVKTVREKIYDKTDFNGKLISDVLDVRANLSQHCRPVTLGRTSEIVLILLFIGWVLAGFFFCCRC